MLRKNYVTLVELLFVMAIIFIFGFLIFIPLMSGGCQTHGLGTISELTVTIEDKYVDTSSSKEGNSSSYMVSTDKGVFEVNNGIFLGIWNADEIYSSLKKGKTYNVQVKGKKVVNFIMQQYPYIIANLGEVETEVREEQGGKSIDDMTLGEIQEWAKRNGVKVEITPEGTFNRR